MANTLLCVIVTGLVSPTLLFFFLAALRLFLPSPNLRLLNFFLLSQIQFNHYYFNIKKMPSDKIDKKRKRNSDRHEHPSKKPALGLQDLPPLSASLVEDDSELAPVIGILASVEPGKKILLTEDA